MALRRTLACPFSPSFPCYLMHRCFLFTAAPCTFGSPSISACASWRCPRFCMKFHQSVCARKSSDAHLRSRSLARSPSLALAVLARAYIIPSSARRPTRVNLGPRRGGGLSGWITGRSVTDRAAAKTGCVCFEVVSGDEWLPRNDRTLN